MTVESGKTGQHLRDQVVELGKEERLRAMQALSGAYLNDSRAALSGLLLAALGGPLSEGVSQDDSARVEMSAGGEPAPLAPLMVGEVMASMQPCANDEHHDTTELFSVS